MRELVQIVEAFENLCREKKPAALATVAAVEGSSYRAPGSRMLTAVDGRTWGSVSGGCLERDVARRGRIVIDSGQAENCCYETGDDGEESGVPTEPGPTLGCGGRIDILIERVSCENPGPIAAMRAAVRDRQKTEMATIVRIDGGDCHAALGQRMIRFGGEIRSDLANESLRRIIIEDLANMSSAVQCVRRPIGGGSADILLERIPLPQALAIFGENRDAEILAELARTLGWHVAMISRRAESEMPELEEDCAAVVMGHNLRRDIAALRWLLRKPPKYVGILGPRHRTRRMLTAAGAENCSDDIRQRFFWPIGLDIGSAGPEQIALAIAAEIVSVMSGSPGGSLRDRPGPIHLFSQPVSQK
jgi:xanthine/CO dehydrogenase XdhC/CoxF family maturation factor